MTRTEYTSICDRCYRGTWFPGGDPCRMSRPIHCGECHQVKGDGPCGGTLRAMDTSGLAPAFAPYYKNGVRIRVTDPATGFTRTGTVGRTMGWKPSYMLMHRSSSRGSWDLLTVRDEVVAVKIGSRYQSVHI